MRNWKAQLKRMPTPELLSIYLTTISSTSFWWTIHIRINESTQAKAGLLLTATLEKTFVGFVWHQCLFSHLTHTHTQITSMSVRKEFTWETRSPRAPYLDPDIAWVQMSVCPWPFHTRLHRPLPSERCLSPTRAINLYRAWETEHNAVVTAKPPLQGHTYKRMRANEGEKVTGVTSPASQTVTPIFPSIPQVFFSFIYSTGISKMCSWVISQTIQCRD